MSRELTRQLKRAVTAGHHHGAQPEARVLAKESALSLLARSIGFGHGRLAIIRLAMAAQAGADIPAEHWRYCRVVASTCKDDQLRALFTDSARDSNVGGLDAAPNH